MKCDSDSIAVAILAGGKGSRIGGNKPRRQLAGKPLLDHALAMARAWTDDVAIVARESSVGKADAPLLRDAPGAEGPIAGLAAALRHAASAGHGAVLTIPCDTPFLPSDLAARLGASLSDEAGAAMAMSAGTLHPTCALWRVRTFFLLGQYLAQGGQSLRGFANHVGFVTVPWTESRFDPFFNVNTVDDLAIAEARWAANGR